MKIFTFRVSLMADSEIWRRIEMRAEHTLEDLHYMIQAAFDWNADHLYAFFMSGEAWDEQSEYTLPEEAWETDWDEEDDQDEEVLDLEQWEGMSEEEQEKVLAEFEEQSGLPAEVLQSMLQEASEMAEHPELYEQEERDVRVTELGSLGLEEGQDFLYLFDFGDEHHFEVRVEKISPFSDPDAIYPAITTAMGDAPPQYPDWDEDEWDKED